MTPRCPCCGQPVADMSTLLVSTSGQAVSRLGETANLTPGQAAVFEVLRKKYPAHATRDALLVGLYWQDNEPDWGAGVLSVHICKLRRRIAPLGLSVAVVWGGGYRLVFHDAAVARRSA